MRILLPSSRSSVKTFQQNHCVTNHLHTHRLISTTSAHPNVPSPSPTSPPTLAPQSVSNKHSSNRQKRIFSGIQPTGVPHLGNYLGALKQWVKLQDDGVSSTSSGGGGNGAEHSCMYCVVDLHALTTVSQQRNTSSPSSSVAVDRSPGLWQRKRETLAALLAVGLDPERSVLFYQSDVYSHAELMWILSCTASMGYLSRMTQWKSKLSLSDETNPLDEKAKASLKLGLFSYPVLQAADVLVHRATHVPVGDDQRQHLEFARECATNFNHTYGNHLVAPDTILSPARRIMSLQNPTKKMSKSDPDPRSRILLTDTPEQITKKIMSALTDSIPGVTYEPDTRPGVANLVELLSILRSDDHQKGVVQGTSAGLLLAADLAAGNASLKDLKMQTAEAVVREMGGLRERYLEVLGRDGGKWLDRVAERGAQVARENAERTMRDVRSAVGLRP